MTAIVSSADRERFARQVAALADADTNDEGAPAWRRAMVDASNRRRAARGIPPLLEWWEAKGELELYERARALGLLD
jgi:hypothetical protein